MNLNPYLDVAPEVAAAVAAGKPVVALESTIISHGMPYPQNVETALKVEQIIRDNGAIPAGVAIALDRMEKGGNAEEVTETSAVQDVEKTFSIPVVSIANLTNLLEFLKSGSDAAQEFTSHTEAVTAYRNRYGA